LSVQLYILAFVLGTALLQRQAALPEMIWVLGLLPIIIAILWHQHYQFTGFVVTKKIFLIIFFFGIGFFWAALFAHWRVADALPLEWERRDIQLVGVVASLPKNSDRSAHFRLDVEHVLTIGATVPERISLSWYKYNNADNSDAAIPKFKVGERWQLTVRLKRPHSNANPYGFDYEAWALERNIRATGYIRQSEENLRLTPMVNRPFYWIERARQEIQQRFSKILADYRYAGVLTTLATGDQHAISREQWQVFTRTGTNHLMAISGLHITMVSSMMFAIVYWLWRWSPQLVLRLPARRIAAVAGLIIALGYTFLSGFAIPAQRAFCMLAVVAFAVWRGRTTSATMVLAWALLLVIIIDPWATLSSGFWLSFGAIAIIMLITVGRIGQMHWLTGWMRVQWAITLGLIPLLLVMFQQVSLVSPIANAVAIPLVSFAVVPLTLLGTIPLFDFVLPLAHAILSVGMMVLQWINDMPQVVWQQHAPPVWTMAAALTGIFWMLLPGSLGLGFFTGFPARWLGLVAMLPMFLVTSPRPAVGELWLTVLDVGQGLAIVARTEYHTLLYDTGPTFGQSDSGSRIIVPFLRGRGIQQLDAMIVSHADSDHSGGALSVLGSIPVVRLFSSLQHNHPIQQAAVNKHPCQNGQAWQWDGVHFEVLHPPIESYDNPYRKTNTTSCVLKITTVHGTVLLPGDIDRKAEYALLDRAAEMLPATVLIAPHHGSNTSSTAAFIHQVNPELTIFTVGYRNRFSHPRDEVVARFQSLESNLLRSDTDGAIFLRFTADGLSVDTWRKMQRRYWQQKENELLYSDSDSEID
jgi:competence protein ComEC